MPAKARQTLLFISKHTLTPPRENKNVIGGEKNMALQEKMNVNAKPALNSLKTEVANELGLANYDTMDKGTLTARQNGYVGGYMTKKLVEMAEQQLSGR